MIKLLEHDDTICLLISNDTTLQTAQNLCNAFRDFVYKTGLVEEPLLSVEISEGSDWLDFTVAIYDDSFDSDNNDTYLLVFHGNNKYQIEDGIYTLFKEDIPVDDEYDELRDKILELLRNFSFTE